MLWYGPPNPSHPRRPPFIMGSLLLAHVKLSKHAQNQNSSPYFCPCKITKLDSKNINSGQNMNNYSTNPPHFTFFNLTMFPTLWLSSKLLKRPNMASWSFGGLNCQSRQLSYQVCPPNTCLDTIIKFWDAFITLFN